MDLVAQELDDRALLLAVARVGDPGHALRAVGGSHVGELLDVAAAPVASALGVDALDDAAALDGTGEDLEVAALHGLGDVDELHAEAHVRAVAAEAVHGLFPLHALQREFVLDADGLEDLFHDVFHHVDDLVAFDEAHLDVDLGELGLAVGAQVLVAEAAGNLVVALDAGAP